MDSNHQQQTAILIIFLIKNLISETLHQVMGSLPIPKLHYKKMILTNHHQDWSNPKIYQDIKTIDIKVFNLVFYFLKFIHIV